MIALYNSFKLLCSLWGGSVINLGTKKHRDKYFEGIDNIEYPGCFAMTELHHGIVLNIFDTMAGQLLLLLEVLTSNCADVFEQVRMSKVSRQLQLSILSATNLSLTHQMTEQLNGGLVMLQSTGNLQLFLRS